MLLFKFALKLLFSLCSFMLLTQKCSKKLFVLNIQDIFLLSKQKFKKLFDVRFSLGNLMKMDPIGLRIWFSFKLFAFKFKEKKTKLLML